MSTSTKTHFNNLDATRFISFLLVFLSHVLFTNNAAIQGLTGYSHFQNYAKMGSLGLDYFFVLSGFLISWIIFEEYDKTKGFNVRFFLIRRSLRILPLYFFIVFLGYSAVSVNHHFFGNSSATLPSIYHFVFFTINFFIANQGGHFLFFLVFLWSIAVEEQFYLFWAFVLKYLKSYFVFICFILIGVSAGFRLIHLNKPEMLYFHTLSLLGNFAIGSLAAYISFHQTNLFNRLVRLKKSTLVYIYLIIAFNFIFYPVIYSHPIFMIFEKILFSIFFGFIILAQSFFRASIIQLGRWPTLNYLGKISYGLYCYHGIVITIFLKITEYYFWGRNFTAILFFNPLIIFMFTVALSILSYELVEKRIVKLKNKFTLLND